MKLSLTARPLLGLAALSALGLAAAIPAQADLTPTLTDVTSAPSYGYNGIANGTLLYTYSYSVSLGNNEQITGNDKPQPYLLTGNYVELTDLGGVVAVGNGPDAAAFAFLTGTGTTNGADGRNAYGTDVVVNYSGGKVTGPVSDLFDFSVISLDGNYGTNNINFTGTADNSSGVLTPNYGTVGGPIAPAPEPSSLAVFAVAAAGLLGLTLRARKLRRAA